jgi:glutamate 5-kinase
MAIQELIAAARKIVFKFGSNTLADTDGRINSALLAEFADQSAALSERSEERRAGKECRSRWPPQR